MIISSKTSIGCFRGFLKYLNFMKASKILLVAILLNSLNLNSQDYIIKGRIIDSLTNQPIPFAHIYFDINHGSVSNIDGIFTLDIISNINSKIFVSCVGYKTKIILIKDLNKSKSNIIFLNQNPYNLGEIEIVSQQINAYQILQSALDTFRLYGMNDKWFYHCSYMEYHEVMSLKDDTNTSYRTVKSDLLLETKPSKRFVRNLDNSIDEKIFFISIDKGTQTLAHEDKVKETNELKYLITENTLNYRNEIFYLKSKYSYTINETYFDSTLNKRIIEVAISPKDTLSEFSYVSVFITSDKYEIIKVHNRFLFSKDKDFDNFGKLGIYKYLDKEVLVEYSIDSSNRIVLSYIHAYFGNSFTDRKKDKVVYQKNVFAKINVLGVVVNGEELKQLLPEMQYDRNIYDQDYNSNQSFILYPEILYLKH
jgi:hypothetical protein